jgi:uncharacterized protein (TIGR03435 family)
MKKMFLSILCLLAFTALSTSNLHAQTASPAPDISGTWQGTLQAGKGLRSVLKISKADSGGWKAVFYSIDQTPQPIPVSSVTLQGTTFKFAITMFSLTYEGTLSADGKTITGNAMQGDQSHALVLSFTTPDNAWALPAPPKPMAADANPSFDVVTIKPGDPNRKGINIGFQGRHFRAINFTVENMIALSYGLHANQIVGAPDWLATDRFDIDGVPDVEGVPSQKQQNIMLQKLLADRFKLVLHHEKKELPVYAITVARGGPKLTKSTVGPNDGIGFGFRKLGELTVRNMTIADFAVWFQGSVTDKPIVDQTGLTDRYDFTLSWTPDESQFAQFRGIGVNLTPPPDDPNAPPGLYTAFQEQLGLKLEPVKAPDDVIVIDHIEKPSAN